MKLALALWLFAASALAVEVPYLSGPVVDERGVLTGEEKARIVEAVESLNASGKIQLAVLVAKSLQGEDTAPFALAVVEKWKLGKKGKDDGALFLVVPDERKMRLEVGYGLEGELPDAICKRILDDVVAPFFRNNRLADGIVAGVHAVGESLGVTVGGARPKAPRRSEHMPIGLLLFLLFLVILFQSFGRSRGWWYGGGGGWGGGGGGWSGGGGGGFGGFSGGGGSFGGGGSSSSW